MEKNSKYLSLKQFYQELEVINKQVSNRYAEIQCKTGCNRCCKFYGSPEIFDFEWENIKNYIEENFTEKDLNRIKRKLLEGFSNLKDYNINNPDKTINVESFFECPFLYKNVCSIYEERPFICRAFGNSRIKNKLMSCTEEINRWGNNSLEYLPEKEDLEKDLTNLFDNKTNIKTIIYWLYKYFKISN